MEGGRSCVNQLFSMCVFAHARVRAGTHFPRNLFEDDSELFLLFSLLLRFQQFMLRNERGKPWKPDYYLTVKHNQSEDPFFWHCCVVINHVSKSKEWFQCISNKSAPEGRIRWWVSDQTHPLGGQDHSRRWKTSSLFNSEACEQVHLSHSRFVGLNLIVRFQSCHLTWRRLSFQIQKLHQCKGHSDGCGCCFFGVSFLRN